MSQRCTSTRAPSASVMPVWPSNDTSMSSAHPCIGSTAMTLAADATSGRTVMVCAQIGVMQMASSPGSRIGPPALSE